MDTKLDHLYEQLKNNFINHQPAIESIYQLWNENRISADYTEEAEYALFAPSWREITNHIAAGSSAEEIGQFEEILVFCGATMIDTETFVRHCLDQGVAVPRCIQLRSQATLMNQRFIDYATQLLEVLTQLLQMPLQSSVQVRLLIFSQHATTPQHECHSLAGLFGILLSAAHENNFIKPQLVELNIDEHASSLWKKLDRLRRDTGPGKRVVRFKADKLEHLTWGQIRSAGQQEKLAPVWKEGGVYLITGGLGGLGLIFANEIANSVANPTLILTGRRTIKELGAEYDTACQRLRDAGATCLYRCVDVADYEAVEYLFVEIVSQFGILNGILHTAGLIRDNLLVNKSPSELQAVFEPKVAGLINLDRVSKNINLDIFIQFSSLASVLGNRGQADYAAANSFMDAYSAYRNTLVAAGYRKGHTLSINWPLWLNGGMRLDEFGQAVLKRGAGIVPMQTAAGIEAFYQAIDTRLDQIVVVAGNLKKFKSVISTEFNQISAHPMASQSTSFTGAHPHFSLAELRLSILEQAAKILEVAVESLDIDVELSDFGFDQVALTELSNALQRKYRIDEIKIDLSGSQTVDELALQLNTFLSEANSRKSIRQSNAEMSDLAPPSAPQHSAHVVEKKASSSLLQEKVVHYFKRLFSTTLKIPFHQIDANTPLEKYGIDSVMILEMTNQLEKVFGSLSKTLFFEYQNIDELSMYFIRQHYEKLCSFVGFSPLSPSEKNDTGKTGIRHTEQPERKALNEAKRSRTAKRNREAQRGVATTNPDLDKIAIIGLSGRYPMASNVEEFWQNLCAGKDCISEIPEGRWEHARYFDTDKNKLGKSYSRWGGFIDGVDQFDPLFFNISPSDAKLMDPQERLFLQCAYEAIEDAGYTREELSKVSSASLEGNVGVFVGAMYEEYQLYGSRMTDEGITSAVTCNPANIANRVSYFCNFHGPSMSLDTMCSSSLTTIHLACQSLRLGETDLAIAGGVNVSIHPNKYLMLSQGRFVSSKGRCESFGEGGEGYVPGEGVGAILLKPLSKAIDDGDHIYGIIRGTAVNHGGRTNGYTVPNPNAQAQVISNAFKKAGVDPRTVSYIEGHGTGTSLGDPIEIVGLNKAFREFTDQHQFCAIGSAKSNIGHCESAAGIAGVTKILMQLKYRKLAPSLHSEFKNPNIDFENSPFVVQQTLAEWERPVVEIEGVLKEYPRIAGISSFGAGGSNAHVIIEEYIPQDDTVEANDDREQAALIVLSARDDKALHIKAQTLLQALDDRLNDENLQNIAFTLMVGREAMVERLAFIVHSHEELARQLTAYLTGDGNNPDIFRGRSKGNKNVLSLLIDEDIDATVAVWMDKRKYSKLLSLWVNGLVIDWRRLYKSMLPKRISLPTYPFSKERYWVELPSVTVPLATVSKALAINADLNQDFFYKPVWKEMPITIPGGTKTSTTRSVLFVYPSFCQNLVNALSLQHPGARTLFIEIADINQCMSAMHWRIHPSDIEQFLLDQQIQTIDQLYFISMPVADKLETFDHQSFRQAYEESTLAFFNLCKAFDTLGIFDRELSIKVIYRMAHLLPGDKISQPPLASGLFGLTKTLCNEYAKLSAVCMDIDMDIHRLNTLAEPELSALARLIVDEPAVKNVEPVVYRNSQRYIRHFEPISLKQPDGPVKTMLRRHGVYMIIGGASGIGLALAKHLAYQYHARIAIVGRSRLDDEKQRMLSHLDELGGKSIYVSADVTNFQSIHLAVKRTSEQLGGINGVIHSAVVLKDLMLTNMDANTFNMVMAPKVEGSWNVARATESEALDFMLFFSSVAGFAGMPGQANYASAASFEDGFALYLAKQRHYPVKVVNWGYWGDVGVATSDYQKEKFALQGILPIETREGILAVEKILAHSEPQVIALKAKEAVLRQFGVVVRQDAKITLPSLISAPEAITAPKLQQCQTVAEVLTQEFSQLSGITIDQLDLDAEWAEMGIDSVKMMRMLNVIESNWGLRVYPNELQEYATLHSFLDYVTNEVEKMESVVGITSPVQDPLLDKAADLDNAAQKAPLVSDSPVAKREVQFNPGPIYLQASEPNVQKPLIYILSTPRAGSTLLRVMLMGNPLIFSPPELHLLPFDSSKQRSQYLKENNQEFLGEGLIETVAELENISANLSVQRMHALEEQDLSIKDIYAMLQDMAGDRFLVDKSPTYANDIAVLHKAEQISEAPLYIFLVRHPLSVIESFVRNRFEKLLGLQDDPWKYAEDLWVRYNNNLRDFLATIPLERQCMIRYEDMVVDPETVIKGVCAKWGIAFDERMLTPYEGKRMTGGLRQYSMTIGDPNFNRHNKIESKLANAWRAKAYKLSFLKNETLQLAQQLGYEIEGQQHHTLLPSQCSFMKMFADDPQWHIVQRFDQSKDFDVARYEKCLQRLVYQHTAFRVSFVQKNGEWRQQINQNVRINVNYTDLSDLDDESTNCKILQIENQLHELIDIEKAPLLVCAIARMRDGRYHVILVAHHLISDGVTLHLINNELMGAYEKHDASLSEASKTDEHARYLSSINDLQQLHKLSHDHGHLKFWQQQIGGRFPQPNDFPKDFPAGQNDIASECSFASIYTLSEFGIHNAKLKAAMFDYLSVALYNSIGEWTNEKRPLISHRLHRRNFSADSDYFSLMGWFAGDVVLGLNIAQSNQDKIGDFQANFRAIPAGGVSYEILDQQGLLPSTHEVAAVRLNFQPELPAVGDIDPEIYLHESPAHIRLYVLDVVVRIKQEQIKIIVRYSKNQYAHDTVKNFVATWIAKISTIITDMNHSKQEAYSNSTNATHKRFKQDKMAINIINYGLEPAVTLPRKDVQ